MVQQSGINLQLSGWNVTPEEGWVLLSIVLIFIGFELMPKTLNWIKNLRK